MCSINNILLTDLFAIARKSSSYDEQRIPRYEKVLCTLYSLYVQCEFSVLLVSYLEKIGEQAMFC